MGLTQDAAAAFLEADVDGNKKLSFEEFSNVVPQNVQATCSTEQLREIFETVDTDGSGDISMDEFFFWTLSVAATRGGDGIEAIFRRYDKTGEGVLDAAEFSRAVEDMGFGSVGHELFLELDKDGSGSVSYAEVVKLLRERSLNVGHDCKRFLTALAYDHSASKKAAELDTSGWRLQANDEGELRRQISALLLESSARVSDLYSAMTQQGVRALHRGEFVAAMIRIGFKGDTAMIGRLFDDIDVDESGVLGIDEMCTHLAARTQCTLFYHILLDLDFPVCSPAAPPPRCVDRCMDERAAQAGTPLARPPLLRPRSLP